MVFVSFSEFQFNYLFHILLESVVRARLHLTTATLFFLSPSANSLIGNHANATHFFLSSEIGAAPIPDDKMDLCRQVRTDSNPANSDSCETAVTSGCGNARKIGR